ncbi:hypothetical protein LP419_00520 [Massilia sp. H-1]|nr:hypothetical protein LP419_00520 [Massilia sp. H-1]
MVDRAASQSSWLKASPRGRLHPAHALDQAVRQAPAFGCRAADVFHRQAQHVLRRFVLEAW